MVRKFKISVNGKEYDVEVNEVQEEQTVLKKPVEKKPEILSAAAVTNAPFIPKEPEKTQKDSAGASGSVRITAPMPGTILKINVQNGQKVKKSEVLLILEAMKMENEITSPVEGVVSSISVAVGNRVNSGEVMIILD